MSEAPLPPGAFNPCAPGTIVLTASFQILLIDRQASALLRTLDSPLTDCDPATALPSSLMSLAEKIAEQLYGPDHESLPDIACRQCVIGPTSRQLRVRGFGLRPADGGTSRIVLVLSPHR